MVSSPRYPCGINLCFAALDGYGEGGFRRAVFVAEVAAPIYCRVLAAEGLDRGVGYGKERRQAGAEGQLLRFLGRAFSFHIPIGGGEAEFYRARRSGGRDLAALVNVRNFGGAAAPDHVREGIGLVRQGIGRADDGIILEINRLAAVGIFIIRRSVRLFHGQAERDIIRRNEHRLGEAGGGGFAKHQLVIHIQLRCIICGAVPGVQREGYGGSEFTVGDRSRRAAVQ